MQRFQTRQCTQIYLQYAMQHRFQLNLYMPYNRKVSSGTLRNENNSMKKRNYEQNQKEFCGRQCCQHFAFKVFLKDAFITKISPKQSGLFVPRWRERVQRRVRFLKARGPRGSRTLWRVKISKKYPDWKSYCFAELSVWQFEKSQRPYTNMIYGLLLSWK